MGVPEYQDEIIALEMPHLGRYLRSYAEADRAVEVRVFSAADGDLVAFITKAPRVPQRLAKDIASRLLELERARSGSQRSRLVFDPNSLPRSGSH